MKRNPIKLTVLLLKLVLPLLPVLSLAVLLGIAGFLAAIAIPVLSGMTALLALAEQPIIIMLIALISCGVLRGLLRYAEQYLNHYVAFKLLAFIRDKVFRALRRLTPAKLEGRGKGDLISVITTDIELLEVFYAHTISPVTIAVIMSIMMTLFIWQYHFILGLIAAAGYVTIGVVLPFFIAKLSGKLGASYRNEFGSLNGYVLESLRGLKEIIQFGMGQARMSAIRFRTDKLSEKAKRLKFYEGLTSALSGACILLFSFGILFAGIALHKSDTIEFEGVFITTIAMISSFGPVIALANLANNLAHTFAAGNRVLDIMEETPVTTDITNGKDIVFAGAACENIVFAYGEERILDNFNIDFPENIIVGITGKSGSGKSTLLRLLMRFWDTNKGNVYLSGEDIRKINTACLRNMESFVTQDTQLFSDTIENNIKIAKPQATHAEVMEACKKAAIHDFIEYLPKGYDTHLGELGEGLSGGERQRIGLARAFLHDAPFLLLDEPTSNLDSLNEAMILHSLRHVCDNKTVVLVSHRKSTMGIADVVHTVEHGRMS
ncbi:MAG: ABC transporter ATP-binding protein/permease [Clostridiales bacterium]|jgi:ATP-binding cassette subfamily C protein|nr:ABC transporter ATP-binding protein/permease [Clostridiales bacterium]